MNRFLTALLASACAVVPVVVFADVPPNLQAQPYSHPIPMVSNLVAQVSGQGKVTLTWNMRAAAHYTIASVTVHRSANYTQPEKFQLGAVHRWSDWHASSGHTYLYQVCAHDSGGETGCADTQISPGAHPGP